jgi:uncharacterized membrane protein
MSMNASTITRRSEWVVPSLLVLLSLVPSAAGAARLVELARGGSITPANARFFAAPLPVVLHVLAVVPYSIIGAFQFAPALRRGRNSWHRRAGWALVVLGLVAALSGLWMARFYAWPEGDGVALYIQRLVFGSAMAISILLAVSAVLRRNFAAHGEWMMRAYAIGLGAGTQVFTHLPWFILVGKPTETPRAIMMGAGWVINLAVAEWIIRRAPRRISGSHARAAS